MNSYTTILLLMLGWIPNSFAEKQKIPLDFNVGLGGSQYRMINANDENDVSLLGLDLDLSVIVYNDTLKKYADKIPKQYRKRATSFGEVAITNFLIPKTIYFSGNRSHRSAAGARWGIVPKVGIDLKWFSWRISSGIILSAIYYKERRFENSKFFFRPGLTLGHDFRFKVIDKKLIFDFGWQYDIFIPQKMYAADKTLWKAEAFHAMLHYRIPFEAEADLPSPKSKRDYVLSQREP